MIFHAIWLDQQLRVKNECSRKATFHELLNLHAGRCGRNSEHECATES